jgi:hypothetical protein
MRRVAVTGLVLGLVVVLGGCGEGARSAAEQVPALSTRLAGIDRAVAAHRYAVARERLAGLVHDTTSARDAGQLDNAAADRILAAAAQLLTALPSVTPAVTPSTTPPPSIVATPTPAPHSHGPKQKPEHGHDKKHGKG